MDSPTSRPSPRQLRRCTPSVAAPVSSSQLALDETPGRPAFLSREPSLHPVGRPGKWARPSWKQDSQEGWSSSGYLSRVLSFNLSMKLHWDFLGQGL